MEAEELRSAARRSPFEPFRIVLTDGQAYGIRHPEMLMVGKRSAQVGVVRRDPEDYYDNTVKVDLLHVIRIEPLEHAAMPPQNGDQ